MHVHEVAFNLFYKSSYFLLLFFNKGGALHFLSACNKKEYFREKHEEKDQRTQEVI